MSDAFDRAWDLVKSGPLAHGIQAWTGCPVCGPNGGQTLDCPASLAALMGRLNADDVNDPNDYYYDPDKYDKELEKYGVDREYIDNVVHPKYGTMAEFMDNWTAQWDEHGKFIGSKPPKGGLYDSIVGRTHDDEGNSLPWNKKTPSWSKITEEDFREMQEEGGGVAECEHPGCNDIAVWRGMFDIDTGYYCADHGPSLSEQKTGISELKNEYQDDDNAAETYLENILQGLFNTDMPEDME